MKSWSESFIRAHEMRKDAARNRGMGFVASYMTDDGPISVEEAIARYGRVHVLGSYPR